MEYVHYLRVLVSLFATVIGANTRGTQSATFLGVAMAPSRDASAPQLVDGVKEPGTVSHLAALVTGVQDIYRVYDCPYNDPDGVCSPGISPTCRQVEDAGLCVLNSCKDLSSDHKQTVIGYLTKIANTAFDCGLQESDLNQPGFGSNGHSTLWAETWIYFLLLPSCAFITYSRQLLVS